MTDKSKSNGHKKQTPAPRTKPSPWVREEYVEKVKEVTKKKPQPPKKPEGK